MKKKYKVENSPRVSNAIKRVISDLHESWSFWYNDSTSDAFGDKVFYIAYEADKYDVINGIHKGHSHGIISYSRGDIRYKRTLSQYAPFMLLSRRYTNFFYVVDENGKMKQVTCMSSRSFREMFPTANVPGANGVFPCEHESRDFLSSKGKKHNHTHSRMKRRRKSRIRARRAF